jgi:FKBP-type peptidyl-prolyl cis-trans isomerase
MQKNRKIRYLIPALVAGLIIIVLASCNSTKKYEEEEAAEIRNYLDSHTDLSYELKASGLYYIDEVVGTGELAVTHDTAYFFYTGYFLDGVKFGSNVGSTDTLIRPVNEGWLIGGFDEALTYMREGGRAKILLPSKLAYFDYEPLLFDIYLARLVPGPR